MSGWLYLAYFAVGVFEWLLATGRTLACIRGMTTIVCSIVFIENLVGLLVLSTFIRSDNWVIALAYSAGAAIGSAAPLLRSRRQ